MGEYVPNPPGRTVYPGAPSTLITQRFADTINYATDSMQNVDDALTDLDSSISSLGMSAGWLDELDNLTVPTVNPIDPSNRPVVGTLVLPDDWPVDFPNLPTLQNSPVVDMTYIAPVKPSQVSPSLNYTPGTYSSALYVNLLARVQEILQNGSSGLNATVEAAILSRRRAQQFLSNAKKYDDDMRAAGATGFNFPAGLVAAIQTDSTTEVLRQDTDFNNAILIQAYESEQKAYFFALEKSLALETILRDFYKDSENRSFETQKAISSFIIQVYAENVKGFIAEWEGVKTELEAKKTLVELVIAENTLLIDAFKAQAQAYISQVEAVAKKTEGVVEGYKGQVTAYEADTRALESYYNTLTAQQRLQIENADLLLRKETTELEFMLKNKLGVDSIKEKIIETRGHIAQQAVASALNAVNASASWGYNGSEAVAEHWAHNESLSDAHSTEHDPTA